MSERSKVDRSKNSQEGETRRGLPSVAAPPARAPVRGLTSRSMHSLSVRHAVRRILNILHRLSPGARRAVLAALRELEG